MLTTFACFIALRRSNERCHAVTRNCQQHGLFLNNSTRLMSSSRRVVDLRISLMRILPMREIITVASHLRLQSRRESTRKYRIMPARLGTQGETEAASINLHARRNIAQKKKKKNVSLRMKHRTLFSHPAVNIFTDGILRHCASPTSARLHYL